LFPVFTIIFSGLAVIRPAAAEPQILGVIATTAPIPLRCEEGECVANLATFYLEPERAQPVPGDVYRSADDGNIGITRLDANGRHVEVGVPVRYFSDYYFTSVQAAVSEKALGADKGGLFFISAKPGAALLPRSSATDADSHTPDEIARALGSARKLAAAYFESGDANVEGAQLINRAVSALPRYARVDEASREKAWQSAMRSTGPLSAKGIATGSGKFTLCLTSVKLGVYYNMRSCLRTNNRQLLGQRNAEFWRVLKPGS
jgi:hypothetical protein